MCTLRELVPAEEEEADESRFQEKGHQAFNGERRPEDIADIMAVIGPVHAKLEFHGNARRHAHGEIDAEQQAPELRHPPPYVAPGDDVDALHDAKQNGESEREGDEQKMIHGRQAELQTRELDDVRGGGHGEVSICFWPLSAAPIRRVSMLPASIF